MKLSGIAAVLSLAVVGGILVFIAVSSHEERLPEAYYSLDKTKPWNQLATKIDPRMSDGEYDAMRSRYFYDVVAPQLSDKSEIFAAYKEFIRVTDRPWQWNRRPSRGELPRVVLIALWVGAAYLMIVLPVWAWKRVLKPVGQIAREDGLAGVAQAILHGRNRRMPQSKD